MCNPTYLLCSIFHDEVPRECVLTGREFVVSHPVVFDYAALSCDFCHCGLPFKCYLQPLPVRSPRTPESAAVKSRIDCVPVAGPLRGGGQLGVFYFSTFHAQRTVAGWKVTQKSRSFSFFVIRRLTNRPVYTCDFDAMFNRSILFATFAEDTVTKTSV